jgi:hypothetical protein
MDHEVYCLAEGSIVLVDTGKEYHPVLGWTKPNGKEYIPMNAGDKDTRPSSYTRLTDFDIALWCWPALSKYLVLQFIRPKDVRQEGLTMSSVWKEYEEENR